MAENINLVGNFTDNITPKLRKLNRELSNVSKSFTKMGGKIRPVTREMGKLAVATDRVADNLRMQRQSLNSTTQAMRAYTTASRKATAQQKKMKPSRMPSAPRAPRGGGGGGGGGTAFLAGGLAAGGMAMGAQLGQQIMMGLSSAFDLYKSVLLKPFDFLASGIQERIDDEMDDIKTAGGLFSISKRMESPFIKNFAEAEQLTKETNRYLAELAGALPGDTQQYIGISRQISDGIYQILANDKEGSLKLAQKIAAENGRVLDYEGMSDAQQVQKAGKELVGEMTKLTVLGSLGQREGAMGLPQLVEQMMSMDEVSSGKFKRYAAIFRDPLIKGALERNVEKINATGKNTSERLEALRSTLEEVVTPDLVRRYQRSTSGVIEELKTLFLNPEVGMLGLGRPLNHMAKTFDEFGNVVTKNGEAVMESLSVFDYLRDIFANLVIAFRPIIQAATKLFTGFEDLAVVLDKVRDFTYKIVNSYERYLKGFEGMEGADLRASLATLNNIFREFGVFDNAQFKAMAGKLKSPDTNLVQVAADMIGQFLQSELAVDFGRQIGEVLGTVLKSFADMLTGAANEEGVANIFTGLVEGFEDAGGVDAAKMVLKMFMDMLGQVLLAAIVNFPVETAFASLVLLFPAIVSGVVAALPSLMALIGPAIGTWITTWLLPTIAGWLGAVGPALASFGAAISAVAAPVLIIVGAVLGLIAIFRHVEFMFDSFIQGLVLVKAKFFEFAGHLMTLIGKIMDFVGNIPGMGHLKEAGQGLQDQGAQMIATAQAEQTAAIQRIAANTEASLARTQQDFTEIGNMIGLASDKQVAEAQKSSKAAYDNLQAVKTGTTAQNQTTAAVNNLGGKLAAIPAAIARATPPAASSYNGNTSRKMSLGSAIASEQKNKPAGSHLVIANSSETVIPANKGYYPNGMGGGGVSLSGVTINVSGVEDPKAIANVVAEEILAAIQKSTYTELYTT